jgi:arylsulfatase A-like enzyme
MARSRGATFVAVVSVLIAAGLAASSVAAAAGSRPNVLLIVTDDQRASGTMQVMPETRRWLARGGTEFERAFATTPLCCPSRASILSGRYAHNHRVLRNDDGQAFDPATSLERHLADSGYATALVGKYLNGWPLERPPGQFDQFWMTLGGYRGTEWNVNGELGAVDRYSTSYVGATARRYIEQRERRDRRPWFLYVAPSAPHGTFEADGGVGFEPQRRYARAPVGPFRRNPAVEEQDLSDKPRFLDELARSVPPGVPGPRATRKGQLRLLMSVDDQVGALRESLRREGELRHTLVIFTSDNGLLWGEHGGLSIKDLPYPPATQVPLLASWPGRVEEGGEDQRLVANVDLAPTILDAAGADDVAAGLDGRSLLDPSWTRERLLLEYFGLPGRIPPWAGVLTTEAQLTVYRDPQTGARSYEFYDGTGDPWQLENPYGTPNPLDDPVVLQELAWLEHARDCAGATCP